MRLASLLVFTALSGCSLLVQFDPDSQPCEANGACLSTHTCINGICRPLADAGIDAGTCNATELNCADGLDDDCDGKADCLDADCNAKACSDGDACTTGEVCNGNSCPRGTAKVCNSPAPCEAPIGTCVASTGQCTYTKKSDGALCGTSLAARCCAGVCANINSDAANCGGCGLSCGTGQACQDVGGNNSCGPRETSGRCVCTGGGTCPMNQACNSTTGLCVPGFNSSCAANQNAVTADAGCPAFCAYP